VSRAGTHAETHSGKPVEAGLRWVRGIAFPDHHSQIRTGNAPHNMRPVGRGRLCTRRTHSDIRGQAAALEEPAARSGGGVLVTRLAQHTYLTPLISRVIGLLAAARASPRTIAVPPTKPKYGTSSVGS
jgi:hypothetical protein